KNRLSGGAQPRQCRARAVDRRRGEEVRAQLDDVGTLGAAQGVDVALAARRDDHRSRTERDRADPQPAAHGAGAAASWAREPTCTSPPTMAPVTLLALPIETPELGA